jgi:hypothetical protein
VSRALIRLIQCLRELNGDVRSGMGVNVGSSQIGTGTLVLVDGFASLDAFILGVQTLATIVCLDGRVELQLLSWLWLVFDPMMDGRCGQVLRDPNRVGLCGDDAVLIWFPGNTGS